MTIRSDFIAAFLSFFVFIANLAGTMQELGLMKEVPIKQQETQLTKAPSSSGGGGGGSRVTKPFDLEEYIPETLENIGEVDIVLRSNNLTNDVTISGLLCGKASMPAKLGKNCEDFRSSKFESVEDFILVSNFYGKFRYSDLNVENGDWIEILTDKSSLIFILKEKEKENYATVTGSVYHLERDYLTSNFTLNISYTPETVVDDVYGN